MMMRSERVNLLNSRCARHCVIDTFFSRAKRFGDIELVARVVKTSVRDQDFIHDCGAKLWCAFGGSKDEVDRQWRRDCHYTHGPRFSPCPIRKRPSARRCNDRAPGGQKRASLEGEAAGGNFKRFETGRSGALRVRTVGAEGLEPLRLAYN